MGHLDTVHPIGTLAQLPIRREGDRAWGPGILDMKGGNYLALEAIARLARAGIATKLPVTVLFTSDEEVGSPSTRDLIEAEAARHRYVLIPEPARADGSASGGVVSGRYAIARFDLEATGRPSHAGARLAEGRSAVREMARQLIAIEDMTTADCTFSVSVIRGGEWVNCVPTTCTAQALSMAKRQGDLDAGVARMLALAASSNEVAFRVTRGRDAAGVGGGCARDGVVRAGAGGGGADGHGAGAPERRRRVGREFHRGDGGGDVGRARRAGSRGAYLGRAYRGGEFGRPGAVVRGGAGGAGMRGGRAEYDAFDVRMRVAL